MSLVAKIKIGIMQYQREVKDIFYLIALQGLNYMAPILVLPYLMVVLGAEKFGYIGFSLAICQYLNVLVDFGFNFSATKKIALLKHDKTSLDKVFSATVYAKLILLSLSFFILLGLSSILQFAVYRTTLLIMFLVVVGNSLLFVFLFQGLGEIRLVSIVNAIAKLAILPLTFIFVKSPEDVNIAAFLQSLVAVFASILSLILIYRKKCVNLVKVSFSAISSEIKDSMPLFLSTASSTVYVACFVVILGFFGDAEEVGRYSAVDRIMRALCSLILVPIFQVFYPKVSSMANENYIGALKLSKKLLIVTFVSTLILSVIMFIGSFVSVDLLGADYIGTEGLFKIMAFTPIFIGTGGIVGQCMMLALGGKKEKIYFQNTYIVAVVVALFFVLLLTPMYKSTGTAYALLITEFTVMVLLIIFSKKYLITRKKC